MSDQTFELVWMQRLGGGSEVLRRCIPAATALTVLQEADREDYGPGGVVFLRPDGETEQTAAQAAQLTELRIYTDTLESIIRGASEQLGQGDVPLTVAIAQLRTAHVDTWKLIGRCDMSFELVEGAKTIRDARARASDMRDEIKKASGK